MTNALINLEQAVYIGPLVAIFLGLFIGSYLNVVAIRWGRKGKNSAHGPKSRSRCPHCRHLLAWYDLIPVLSFITLKGKCRYCRTLIAFSYPLIEIITGLIFGLTVTKYDINLNAIMLLILAGIMIIISLVDLRLQIIPDQLTIIPTLIVILYLIITGQNNLIDQLDNPTIFAASSWLVGLLVGLGLITMIVLITKGRGMGVGDIKLAGLIGTTVGGVGTLIALSLAFVIGGSFATWLLAAKKAGLKSAIAFGPFLVTGWLITIMWLESILKWYT